MYIFRWAVHLMGLHHNFFCTKKVLVMLGHVCNLQSVIEIPQNGKFIGGQHRFCNAVKLRHVDSFCWPGESSLVWKWLLHELCFIHCYNIVNRPFLPTKFHWIFTNVTAHLHCTLYQFMHSLKTETSYYTLRLKKIHIEIPVFPPKLFGFQFKCTFCSVMWCFEWRLWSVLLARLTFKVIPLESLTLINSKPLLHKFRQVVNYSYDCKAHSRLPLLLWLWESLLLMRDLWRKSGEKLMLYDIFF